MSVILYSTPNCSAGAATRLALQQRGIAFEEIDPLDDMEAATFVFCTLGHGALPVVYLDAGQHWFGYRPDRLNTMMLNRDPSLA